MSPSLPLPADEDLPDETRRRYLEHLNETGKAEVTLRYGEVGRPERRYAWR